MRDQVPEPLDTQFRKAREARDLFGGSFLIVTLSSLLLDVILVAGGWVTGSVSRTAWTLLGIDAVILGVWIISTPLRRWLTRSAY